MTLRLLVILFGVAVLASCASLSEDACRKGDWGAIGFRDGDAGRAPSFVVNHAKACNKIGIAPNRQSWEVGYDQGLIRYCIPARAFEEGRDGARLNNVCPAGNLAELRAANARGLEWYGIERDIRANRNRIHAIDAALSDIADGEDARTQLVAERSILRLENLRLRQQQRRIRF